jgi:hypothetical protein
MSNGLQRLDGAQSYPKNALEHARIRIAVDPRPSGQPDRRMTVVSGTGVIARWGSTTNLNDIS